MLKTFIFDDVIVIYYFNPFFWVQFKIRSYETATFGEFRLTIPFAKEMVFKPECNSYIAFVLTCVVSITINLIKMGTELLNAPHSKL